MTINDSAISEQGMCEEEQVARIAWFYYHDGLTQSEISDRLGLTRLKVSRLLEKGHQSGISPALFACRLILALKAVWNMKHNYVVSFRYNMSG